MRFWFRRKKRLKPSRPIGRVVSMTEDANGLTVVAMLNKDLPPETLAAIRRWTHND